MCVPTFQFSCSDSRREPTPNIWESAHKYAAGHDSFQLSHARSPVSTYHRTPRRFSPDPDGNYWALFKRVKRTPEPTRSGSSRCLPPPPEAHTLLLLCSFCSFVTTVSNYSHSTEVRKSSSLSPSSGCRPLALTDRFNLSHHIPT